MAELCATRIQLGFVRSCSIGGILLFKALFYTSFMSGITKMVYPFSYGSTFNVIVIEYS